MTSTEGDVVLRPAGADDAAAVAAVHLAARAAAPMPTGVHPSAEVREWLAGRIGVDDTWVAEVDGAVVA